MIFAGLSYTCAAIAMAVLTGMLLTRYRHSDLARRVAIVCAVSAVWAVLLAFSARLGERREWRSIAADALRYAGWLFALSTPNSRSLHPWILRGGFLLRAALVVLAFAGAFLPVPAVAAMDPVRLHNAS